MDKNFATDYLTDTLNVDKLIMFDDYVKLWYNISVVNIHKNTPNWGERKEIV